MPSCVQSCRQDVEMDSKSLRAHGPSEAQPVGAARVHATKHPGSRMWGHPLFVLVATSPRKQIIRSSLTWVSSLNSISRVSLRRRAACCCWFCVDGIGDFLRLLVFRNALPPESTACNHSMHALTCARWCKSWRTSWHESWPARAGSPSRARVQRSVRAG